MPAEQDDDVDVGPLIRAGASLVYDSVHERVLMYGGWVATPEGATALDDLWQYDPITHQWSQLLDATQRLVSG